jgi:hypothetical protein
MRKFFADIAAGVDLCRQKCEYFSVCGGGEPINKLSENGSFISTETTFCKMTRMRPVDLVLGALDQLERKDGTESRSRGRTMVRSVVTLVILLAAISAGSRDVFAGSNTSGTSKSKVVEDPPAVVKTPAPSGPLPMSYPNVSRERSAPKKSIHHRDR